MAAGKQFELLFQLTARLGPNFSQSFKNASKTMNALQNDLRSADQKLKDVSAYQKQQNAVAKSKARVNELQEEHERLTREIEETGQATPQLTRQLQANERALAKAKDATASEEKRLQELSDTLREAGVNTDNLGRDTEELRERYERLEQAQKKVQEISEKQAANKQAISQTKAQLGGLIGTVAAVGTAFYAGPVKKAAEFQEQMSTVKAISNASAGDMEKLSQKAKEMGAKTAFTAAEAGKAMEYMAMAGWKTEDMLGGIDGIMNLASASGEELGAVSDIVTDALTAFGLSASDAGHFSDVLAQASSNANTNVSMMGSTFQKVAPVAGALGYSVEDMSLGIGLMANASIKADVAGTSLKTALANMAKPTKQQAAYMDKYGISLTKSDGTMKSFGEVVENLRGSLGGLSEQEQIAAASAIFGKESFSGMLAIVNASEQDFNKLTQAVYNCDGAAKRMAETKLDNLNGSITLAKSAFDALQVELGELLLPTLTEGIKKFTDIINVVTTFARENPQVIATVAKVAAGLVGMKAGGLVAKLGFLQVKGGILSVQKAFAIMSGIGIDKYMENAGKGTKVLVKTFEKIRESGIVKTIGQLGGGFGGILTKVAPLVGVIAAVGGAVYYVSTHLEQVRGFIQKTFGDEGLAVFDKLWGIITQVGTALKDAFFTGGPGVLDTLKSVLPTIITTLQTGLLPLLPMIADLVMQIVPLVGQLITAILPVLGQLISAILPVLATLVAEVLPVIVQFISAILPLVLQIVQSVLPVFIQLVNTILPILAQIIQAVLPVIIQLVQTLLPIIMQIVDAVLPMFISLLNTVVPIFQNIIQAILPVLQQLLQALMPVIQLLAEMFGSVLGSALQSIANIVSNVMQIFQGLIDFITGVFTGNWSQAWEGIKSIFSGAVGGLGEIIKAPLRAVVSAVNTVIGGLNKLKIPEWVPGLGGKGINIPRIPGFAKGTDRTPGTFIAGENGPELITDAANRKVFTAAQTGQIFNNMAQAGNLNTANNVNATAGGAGTITVHVTNSPSVTVAGGGDAGGIKEQLQQYDEEFLEKLRTIIITVLKEQREQEARVAYA